MFKWYYYNFLKSSMPYDFQKISIAAPSRYKAVHGLIYMSQMSMREKSHSNAKLVFMIVICNNMLLQSMKKTSQSMVKLVMILLS